MLLSWIVLCAFVVQCKSQPPGGPAEENREEMMPKAWKAATKLNEENTSIENYMIPIKVLTATSQVVAGNKYEFEAVYGESNCTRTAMEASDVDDATCYLKEDPARAIYNVTVWEKSWENFEEYTITKNRDVSPEEQF